MPASVFKTFMVKDKLSDLLKDNTLLKEKRLQINGLKDSVYHIGHCNQPLIRKFKDIGDPPKEHERPGRMYNNL